MAKDKVIGALIMVIGILMAIIYTLGSIVDLLIGFEIPFVTALFFGRDPFSWALFVVLPLWLLVILISIIAIWIGYSMLTVDWQLDNYEQNPCTCSIRGIRGRACS